MVWFIADIDAVIVAAFVDEVGLCFRVGIAKLLVVERDYRDMLVTLLLKLARDTYPGMPGHWSSDPIKGGEVKKTHDEKICCLCSDKT